MNFVMGENSGMKKGYRPMVVDQIPILTLVGEAEQS